MFLTKLGSFWNVFCLGNVHWRARQGKVIGPPFWFLPDLVVPTNYNRRSFSVMSFSSSNNKNQSINSKLSLYNLGFMITAFNLCIVLRVSKFVANNVFNNVILNSTMNDQMNSTNNDKK